MGTYVVGDLHGCFDEWITFKESIEEFDSDAVFILVGDIIDRGAQEKEMYDWCETNVSKNGKYQMVIGNHEYEQMIFERDRNRNIFYHQLPLYKDIVVNGRRFIIAHANIPYTMVNADGTLKSDSELSDIEKFDIVWSRSLQSFNAIPGAILVHGHNPTVFEDSFRSYEFTEEMLGRIYNLGNRYNVDCGLVYEKVSGHRLAALRLDDLREFYNDNV